MYVANAPPNSSTTPIPQAKINAENAKLVPMSLALQKAMQWPCFAPNTPFNAGEYGPAVVTDAATMQALSATTAAASAAASSGTANPNGTSSGGSDSGVADAPTIVPLNPYAFASSIPSQSARTGKSCPVNQGQRFAAPWAGQPNGTAGGGLLSGGATPWLVALAAALGIYGLSQMK
jgi:hypothetical protein